MAFALPTSGSVIGLAEFARRLSEHIHPENRAAQFIEELASKPRVAPSMAAHDHSVSKIRKFISSLKSSNKNDHSICKFRKFISGLTSGFTPSNLTALKTELLAFRLGLTAKNLTDHPDFAAFAESNRLYNYLAKFNHRLTVDRTGAILIGPSHNLKNWSEVKALALKRTISHDSTFYQPWKYGPDGIQDKEMFDWNEIEPFMQDDPAKWGGGYAFQLCTTIAENPRLQGDHTFIRLCTPNGQVYSIGLYRPEKRYFGDNYLIPLRVKRARLMSPDVSEFWGVKIQVLTVAITEEDFHTKKAKIEESNQSKLAFHPLNYNCTRWAMDIASISNSSLDCRTSSVRAMVSPCLVKYADKIYPLMPYLFQKVAEIAISIIFNIISVLFGSLFVDPEMEGTSPHIKSPFDLFRANKLVIESPHKLGAEIIPLVEKWREEQIKMLEKRGASLLDINKVRWGLPPKEFWQNAS